MKTSKYQVEELSLSIEMAIASLKSCTFNELDVEYKRLSKAVRIAEDKLEGIECRSKRAVEQLCKDITYGYDVLLSAKRRESAKSKSSGDKSNYEKTGKSYSISGIKIEQVKFIG